MKNIKKRNKTTISKEKLVNESDESDYAHAYDNSGTIGQITEVEVYANQPATAQVNETDLSFEDKSYVMNKFLATDDNELEAQDEDDVPVRDHPVYSVPIPKRRSKSSTEVLKKNKIGNKNSDDQVRSFNADDEDVESNISQVSNVTYDVPVPIPKKRTFSKQRKVQNDNMASTSKTSKNKIEDEIEMHEFVTFENEKKTRDGNKSKQKPIPKVRKNKNKITVGESEDEKDIDETEKPNNKTNKILQDDKSENLSLSVHDNDNEKMDNANSSASTDNEILAIKLIKTDRLLLNSYVLHPVVRIHLINSETGDYVKKSDIRRNVLLKVGGDTLDYIDYRMSKPFDLIKNRQIIPNWNEIVFFNEDFAHLQTYTSLMIFFEIVDSTNAIYDDSELTRHIAWAFLKPQNYYNENLRLQLFYPQNRSNKFKCNAFYWWKKNKMRKYPSTLYVALKNTSIPSKILKLWMTKVNEEEDNEELSSIKNINLDKTEISEENLLKPLKFDNAVKIPSDKFCEVTTLNEGCFLHKFSNNGDFLAVATSESDNLYFIIIYSICGKEEVEEVSRLEAHQGLIYDLQWSPSDHQLISVSADCTLAIWDVSYGMHKLEHIFPHTTFVYCCAFSHTNANSEIASGGYDGIIRIWSLTSQRLIFELTAHQSDKQGIFVTSICFNKDGYFMYSADSTGCILMWHKEENTTWNVKQEIKVLDLKNLIINQILLHRRERRLIVNARDGCIRQIDIKTGYVLQNYSRRANNGLKEKQVITCALTPCGTYLISGSENGDVFVWGVDSGKCEQVYSPYQLKITIHCVQFQAKYNLISASHFGNNVPVIIYGSANGKVQQKNGGNLTLNKNNYGEGKKDGADFTKMRNQGANFRKILEKFDNVMAITH